jgi:hypothetical protein
MSDVHDTNIIQNTREECLNPHLHKYQHHNNVVNLWNNQQILEDYILLLKRGNEQRRWLLRDMNFNIDLYVLI